MGMKLRGFGKGWWNGFGGKLEGEETYEESASRETFDEAKIRVGKLIHVANLHFYFDDELGVVARAYTADFEGEPEATDEMRPQLFQEDSLPFDDMWPADRLWIPKVLTGNLVSPLGFVVHFGADKSFRSIQEVDAQKLEHKF